MSFHSMLARLEQAQVRCVVVGGIAGTVHGSAYITQDLDICYDATDENRTTLAALLASWGVHLRGAPPDLPFTLDSRALRTTPLLTLRTREGDIDLLDQVPGVGGYTECLAASEAVEWDGTRFRVLTLPALIAAKRAAGRRKDREHLIELEALLALRDHYGGAPQ